MNNEFSGRVSQYQDKSGLKKKDQTPYTSWCIIIEEDVDQYPDSLVADYYGEKIAPPSINDVVKVGFHYRSSITPEGKIFGQNSIWKLDILQAAPKEDAPAITPTPPTITPTENAEEGADLKSKLPF